MLAQRRLVRQGVWEAEHSGAGGPPWRGDRVRRGWAVSQTAVGPLRVIVAPPCLDEHPGFRQGVEHLPIQQFVAELAVERFIVAVLPGTGLLDVEGCHAQSS